MIKKGDLVTATGALKEVVDFLASADKEKMRLLNSLLDSADPVADAKLLQTPKKVTKVYKDSIEVALSKDFLWEEKKDCWTEVANVPKAKANRRIAPVAKDIQDPQPLSSASGWVAEPAVAKDSKERGS